MTNSLEILQLDKNDFKSKETILRKIAKPVESFDNNFQEIVNKMIYTLEHDDLAVGLAAPQINIPISLAVINLNVEQNETLILVNPVITQKTGKKDKKKESCMSLPHYRGEVVRRSKVKVEYQDRYGSKKELNASGFFARVIQHEVDHLNGVLYIDKMDVKAKLEDVDFFKD